MAKKTSTALAVKHALARVRARPPMIMRLPAPIVKVKKTKHKRHGHGGGGRDLMNKERMGIVVGSFAVGILEKQKLLDSLPALPFIGKTGTIGIGAYLLSNKGHNKLADEVCTAALVIAAHELASTGTIVGQVEGAGGGAGDAPAVDVGYVAGW
jgi:hypothetical protein